MKKIDITSNIKPKKNNDLNSINVAQATSIALYELASDM